MEPARAPIDGLVDQLSGLERYARALEAHCADALADVHPAYHASARNLLHYLALRHHDLRRLQDHLGELGVSRLGRAEAHVLASVAAVRANLERRLGRAPAGGDVPIGFRRGRRLLRTHADALLGEVRGARDVRILVTLPSEAADDYAQVRALLEAGMDCARLNAAHDDPEAWARMVAHVRRAERELGRRCLVCMDLAGPKLRLGPLADGPRMVRLRPERDVRGIVVAPCAVWLAARDEPPPPGAVHLPVEAGWAAQVRLGDEVRFADARGKRRRLAVVAVEDGGVRAETPQSAYIETGTCLELRRDGTTRAETLVGPLPPVETALVLQVGDRLVVHASDVPGGPAEVGADGRVRVPAHVACPLPGLYADVRPGEPVRFDDGKIEGVVRRVTGDALEIEITYARPGGSKLRGGKGINLPESELRLRGLTGKDRDDLAFAVRHVDAVSLSFVNDAPDVDDLLAALDEHGAPEALGVVVKIETRRGVQNLPSILLAAMRRHPVGVMIARGDLAVECGWNHLAETQEELMRVCEAAHVPVIWATQVLEQLAKKGRPSRAEITDAAMSQRAEAVMLNKGPYILDAIRMLDEILTRMQDHRRKKAPLLPRLPVPNAFEL